MEIRRTVTRRLPSDREAYHRNRYATFPSSMHLTPLPAWHKITEVEVKFRRQCYLGSSRMGSTQQSLAHSKAASPSCRWRQVTGEGMLFGWARVRSLEAASSTLFLSFLSTPPGHTSSSVILHSYLEKVMKRALESISFQEDELCCLPSWKLLIVLKAPSNESVSVFPNTIISNILKASCVLHSGQFCVPTSRPPFF